MNIQLFIIDPQVDFMDSPGSTLPVTGANADMGRLAKLIDRVGGKLDDIHVTMDSHRVIDVGHPGMWVNQKGKKPDPFTVITADDIDAGIWRPRNEHVRPRELGGQTLGEYMLGYARALAKSGKYPLMVWPEHCIIGSPGHNIQPVVLAALQRWERDNFATVDFVTKGTDTYVEHYGALMAEVPLASDPSTSLRTDVLAMLAAADIVAVPGEASSHCVKETVQQVADNIGEEHISKFHLITDCMSPVIHPTIDFPAIAAAWMKDMEKRGMVLTTSDKFLK